MAVHKCPVCEGKGFVPGGFYSPMITYTPTSTPTDAASFEKCRACDGSGYIVTPDSQSYCCRGCANCGNNDGLAYTSSPVKYKCNITNEYHEASYVCSRWASKPNQIYTSTCDQSEGDGSV